MKAQVYCEGLSQSSLQMSLFAVLCRFLTQVNFGTSLYSQKIWFFLPVMVLVLVILMMVDTDIVFRCRHYSRVLGVLKVALDLYGHEALMEMTKTAWPEGVLDL